MPILKGADWYPFVHVGLLHGGSRGGWVGQGGPDQF